VGSLSLKDVFDSSDLQKLYTFVDQSWKTWICQSITVWYNYFKNTMKQIPVGFQLFPLSKKSFEEFVSTLDLSFPAKRDDPWKQNYMKLEPSKKNISQKTYDIMMNIIIYGALLHNKTWEFASRMLAMKWAKDNATTIINDLTLAYNKARQDAITKEVLEIVSAKAVIEH
jgi:F-type H+-transporting ATPase subunit gamma